MTSLARAVGMLAAAAVLATMSSCADKTSDAAAEPQVAAGLGALAGRSFLSTEVRRSGVLASLAGDSRVSLRFDERGASVQAGCNTMSAPATYDGGRLTTNGPVAGTEMGCSPALMRQDAWLARLLETDPIVALDGHQLMLTAGDTVVQFLDREVADPDRPLVGTTWRLDSIGHGDSIGQGDGADRSVSSVPLGLRSTIRFHDPLHGTVVLGCNRASIEVRREEHAFLISPYARTDVACDMPGDAGEAAVLAVLGPAGGQVDYSVDAATLTLTNGQRILTYRAVD